AGVGRQAGVGARLAWLAVQVATAVADGRVRAREAQRVGLMGSVSEGPFVLGVFAVLECQPVFER
ncbi:hypothetical protein, partial [Candidatus Entotheonella palauensis]|uniref:hypothetical protein n=1 Tax=Candidatus Entotheonella palauensis TaxID=93172 RepID=UPI0015C4BC8C